MALDSPLLGADGDHGGMDDATPTAEAATTAAPAASHYHHRPPSTSATSVVAPTATAAPAYPYGPGGVADAAGAGAGSGAGAALPRPSLPRAAHVTPSTRPLLSFTELRAVQQGLATARAQHQSGEELVQQIQAAASGLERFVRAQHVSSISSSYDDLLARLMLEGETVSFEALEFDRLVMKADDGKLLKRTGRGRILLTNKRVLLLTCAPSTDGNVTKVGNPKSGPRAGCWKVEYGYKDAIWYQAIANHRFKMLELDMYASATATQNFSAEAPGCCSAMCCFQKLWQGQPVVSDSQDTRTVKLWYSRPPWNKRATLELGIPKLVPTVQVVDFCAHLQTLNPEIAGISYE